MRTTKSMSRFTLEYGDTGMTVKEAQELLVKCGSTIKPNGDFSIGMVSAVKAFQRKNGLKVTGKVDSATWKKLDSCAKPVRKKKASK